MTRAGIRIKTLFMTKTSAPVTIVLARVEQEPFIVKQGQIDLGKPHTFGLRDKAVAMVWVNSGSEHDVAKAEEFARANDYRVFTYPWNEEDPLGRAKADALKGSTSAKPG